MGCILYGGSATPANATQIVALADVGGMPVSGASLKAEDFESIFRSAEAAPWSC
jgi:triosephosphate isomerase